MPFHLLLLASRLVVAQTLGELNPQTNASFEGNVDYYAIGATLGVAYIQTNPSIRADGLACLLPSATVTVPPGALSGRATLRQAFLYYSGNQQSRSGGVTPIDKSVQLLLPTQTTPITLTVADSDIHTVSYVDGNDGNATNYFYSARVDITALLQKNGTFVGDYTLSGLETPVCYQFDVACTPGLPDAQQPHCDDTSSPPDINANATASFFIVLVYSDPALPPRQVTLYDGLQLLDQSTVSAVLTGLNVPPIPRGKLTMYVIEGDLNVAGDTASVSAGGRAPVPLGNAGVGPSDCSTDVQSVPCVTEVSALVCGNSSWPNWNENIFDSSITGADTTNACVRGVDVDTFDISPVLKPGDNQVTLTMSTTNDRVAVVFAALGVDDFRPIINVDSRKEVIGLPNDIAEPKTTFTYRIGISNTGNVPATGVEVTDDMPRGVGNLVVKAIPPGSTDASTTTGGTGNAGLVDVKNITVNPGDIYQILYTVDVVCPISSGAVLRNSALISDSAEGAPGITVFAPPVTVSDPNGDICAGRKPPDQKNPLPVLDRRLLGGAGCSSAGAPLWFIVASIAAVRLLQRRRFARSLVRGHVARSLARLRERVGVRVLLFLVAVSCGKGVAPPPPPPPVITTGPVIPVAPAKPTTFPGTVCADATMVKLPSGVCVDRFENVITGAIGNADQSAGKDGSTTGTAAVTYGSVPTAGVSYYQAKALCENGGKRLCTDKEWEQACRGPSQSLYPYGDTFEQSVCNGFDADFGVAVQSGAMTACFSDFGSYDMSGNLSEWVEADFPLLNGNGKQIRGSSFIGNTSGLACSTQVGEMPATVDANAGVRCCK